MPQHMEVGHLLRVLLYTGVHNASCMGMMKMNSSHSAALSIFGFHSSSKLGLRVQEKALQDVVSIMGCSRGIARTLLMHFRWSTETLFGKDLHIGKGFRTVCWCSLLSFTKMAWTGSFISICMVQVSWRRGTGMSCTSWLLSHRCLLTALQAQASTAPCCRAGLWCPACLVCLGVQTRFVYMYVT
jgi:hypothetical protein